MRIKTLLFLLASTGVSLSATELIQNGDFQDPVFSGNGQDIAYTDWVENGSSDANGSGSSNLTPGGAYNQVIRLGSSRYCRQDINASWTAEHKFLLTFNAKEIWWRGGNTGDQVWVTIRDVSNNVYWATGKVNLDGTHTGGSQTDWVDMGGNASGDQSYRYVITGADLVATGMTEGQTLRLNFANGGNSVIQMDNISLEMTVPNKGNFIFTGSQQGASAVTFPFETDFEVSDGYSLGPLYSDTWWQSDLGLDLSIITPGAASSQALDFFGGEAITLFTDSGAAAISWIDFFIKPVYVDDEDLSPLDYLQLLSAPRSTVTGFIRVQNNSGLGELYVADGSVALLESWVYTGIEQQLVGDTAVDWLRLTYRIDFTTKRWDLFVDDQMVVTDLGFLDTSITELSSFTIMSDDNDPTQLDYFYAGNTNPLFTDTSNDGLPDTWLIGQGLDINVNQRENDADGDGLVNLVEYQLGTSAALADTDGDGIDDSTELENGFDPLVDDGSLDPDGDWLTNVDEINFGLDPHVDDVAGTVGLMPRDIWLSVGGNSARNLTNLSDFPSGFDQRLWLTELAVPPSESLGMNYGQRIHGQLIAPETADYTFWVAGDNDCELWLSSDDAPFNKQLLASVSGWTNYQQWAKFSTQESVTVSLVAGQSYYIEVIHKEGAGGDHVAVAWAYGSTPRTIIAGQYLQVGTVHSNDIDDDGLPDHWERWQSLDDRNGSAENGFWGDPDGDGVPNYLERLLGTNSKKLDTDGDGMNDLWEYENGLNPLVDDADLDPDGDGITNLVEYTAGFDPNTYDDTTNADGIVQRDAWFWINSRDIPALTNNWKFPNSPNNSGWASDLDFPQSVNYGDNYGQRIYGLIVAPETDLYTFWIAGDGECEFWLSSDEKPSNRERLAYNYSPTSYKEWSRYATQQSVQVELDAGQTYYFEILHKDGGGTDSVAVAWQYGDAARHVITSDHLRASAPEAGDADRDGLPDSWESANGLGSTKGHGVNGYAGDLDGDGIPNYQERQLGTRADLSDTDGDGYSDGFEITKLFSDPTVADLVAGPVVVSTIDGASFADTRGSWSTEGTELYSVDSTGSVSYDLNFPAAAAYRIVVEFTEQNAYKVGSSSFELRGSLNGVNYGIKTAGVSYGGTAKVMYHLPYLPSGDYTFDLDWLNGFGDSFLRIRSLRVERIDGLDLDQNGIADWVESRASQNGSEAALPIEIYTSPFCLEGTSFAPATVAMITYPTSDSTDVRSEVVSQALYNSYYSDIILLADEDRVVLVNDQSGLRTSQYTLTWAAFNAVIHDFLHIRLNDSMLITAIDSALPQARPIELQITAPNGVVEVHNLAAEARLQVLFDQTGDWNIQSTLLPLAAEDPVIYDSVVRVSSASLAPAPIIFENSARTWEPSISDTEVVVESDAGLPVYEASPGTMPRSFELNSRIAGGRLVARLPNGSVLSTTEAKVVRDYSREQTYNQVVETFADGSTMVSAYIYLNEVPEGLSVHFNVWKSGITFDDGTISRTITAEDFDEKGRYLFYLLRAPGVNGGSCYGYNFTQDGVTIGSW